MIDVFGWSMWDVVKVDSIWYGSFLGYGGEVFKYMMGGDDEI